MIPSAPKPKKQPTTPLEPADLGDAPDERDDFLESDALDAHGHGEQKDAAREADAPGTGATHGDD